MKIKHKHIIQIMEALFPKEEISIEGVCYGFSSKYADAFFSNDLEAFENRIEKIESYLSSKEASEGISKMLEDIKNTRKKCKNLNYQPSEEDKELIDILGFFEGILFQQFPYKHQDIFMSSTEEMKDLEENSSLLIRQKLAANYIGHHFATAPRKLLENKELKPELLKTMVLGLNSEEIKEYLSTVEKMVKENGKIGVMLHNGLHAIFLSYDKNKKGWTFMDINKYPAKKLTNIEKIFTSLASDINDDLIVQFDLLGSQKDIHSLENLDGFNDSTYLNKTNKENDFPLALAIGQNPNLDNEALKKMATNTLPKTLNKYPKNSYHPLVKALNEDNSELVQLIFNKGVSVDSVLFGAISSGMEKSKYTPSSIRTLLKVNIKNGVNKVYQKKLLHEIIKNKRLTHSKDRPITEKELTLIFNRCKDVLNEKNEDGFYPFASAILNDNELIIKELIKNNVDLSLKYQNLSLAEFAIKSGYRHLIPNYSTGKGLKNEESNKNKLSDNINSSLDEKTLMEAIKVNNIKMLELLASQNVNFSDEALYEAVSSTSGLSGYTLNAVILLLENSTPVNIDKLYQVKIMQHIVKDKNILYTDEGQKLVRLIFDRCNGVLNEIDEQGACPLANAIMFGDVKMVEELIKQQDINLSIKYGELPLTELAFFYNDEKESILNKAIELNKNKQNSFEVKDNEIEEFKNKNKQKELKQKYQQVTEDGDEQSNNKIHDPKFKS